MVKSYVLKYGQSAAKLRGAEGSTTIPYGSRFKRAEVVGIRKDDDIVYALVKTRGRETAGQV